MIGVAHRSGDKAKLGALNALMPGQSKCPVAKSRSRQTLENKRQLCSDCCPSHFWNLRRKAAVQR